MDIREVYKFGVDPESIYEYIDKIKNGDRIIVVTGEFSSGKSSFTNAFIGEKDFLPQANKECTPVLLDLVSSDEKNMVIKYKDGTIRSLELTAENVEFYATNHENYDFNILSVSVPVSSTYLESNTHFIDTPGTNTVIAEQEEITNYILKKADVVLYVVNKAITQYDIDKIKEIMKYTDQIAYIITHMDEECEWGYRNRSREEVARFIDEARKELERKLDIKEPDILPVGSVAAYDYPEYIDEIREVVKEYIELNSTNVIKQRVKRQLEVIFERKFDTIKESLEMYENLYETNGEELQRKIDNLNKKIKKLEDGNEKKVITLQEFYIEISNIMQNKVKKLFKDEEERILKVLLSNKDISQEEINRLFESTSHELGEKLKVITEGSINDLINLIYDMQREDLKSISQEFNVNLSFKAPSIESFYFDIDESKVENLKEQKEQMKYKLSQVQEEMALAMEDMEVSAEYYNEVKQDELTERREMKSLGSYVPEYETKVLRESGGKNGKVVGRLMGEMADVALMFYNPVAAISAMSGVLVVKDGAKITQYIGESIEIARKKAKDKKNKEKNKFLKALDLVSIGYYGEKVGQKLGETVKPLKTVLVENEEKRQEWEDKREDIMENIMSIKRKRTDLEYDIANNRMQISEARRRKRELEDELNKLQELELDIVQKINREKEMILKSQSETYYKEQIDSLIEKEEENAQLTAATILGISLRDIVSRSEEDIKAKIQEIKETLFMVKEEKEKIKVAMEEKASILEEITPYKQWIEEWIENECS